MRTNTNEQKNINTHRLTHNCEFFLTQSRAYKHMKDYEMLQPLKMQVLIMTSMYHAKFIMQYDSKS